MTAATTTSSGAVRDAPVPDRVSRRGPEVVDGGATTPGSAIDDLALLAAMSRALREAGWTTDRDTAAASRHGRETVAGAAIDWTTYDDGTTQLAIWRWIDGYEHGDYIVVTSVQQAVDVLAALTRVGVHLTTGAQRAARLAEQLLQQAHEHITELETAIGGVR